MTRELAHRSGRRRFAKPVSSALASAAVLALLLPCPGTVAAQETALGSAAAAPSAGARPNWILSTSLLVDGTYTDNVLLNAAKKSDFVTQLSPGVKFAGRSARAEASLNYQLHQFAYAGGSAPNALQKSLAARGKLELIDQWMFVEASHNTSQRSASAFATQSASYQPNNSNSTETTAFSFSPYIQGRLAGLVDYQLRYSGSQAHSSSGALSGGSNSTTGAWNARLSGATPLARVGWSLSADSQLVSHNTGVDSRSERLIGTLSIELDPQIRLLIDAGRDSDNFNGTTSRKGKSLGIGLNWAPTERTLVSLKKDQRSFGDAHAFNFSHRTALSAWKFTDSRDVFVSSPGLAQAETGTAYDLLYLQLASLFPDPTERAAEASRQLAKAGIGADTPTFGKILTSQVFIERKQLASLALTGANNTVIFAIDRRNSQRIGSGLGFTDDFAANAAIRQSGFNVSWAHKLTPDAALSLNARTGRSEGSANLETSFKALSLQFTSKLGANTQAAMGLRKNRFANTVGTGYDETAVTGSMQMAF